MSSHKDKPISLSGLHGPPVKLRKRTIKCPKCGELIDIIVTEPDYGNVVF
jgi:hypothetical protein